MRKMGKRLVLLAPLLLLAAGSSAQASSTWDGLGGIGGAFCHNFSGGFCNAATQQNSSPPQGDDGGNGGAWVGGVWTPSDPKPVPEPEMLGLIAVSVASAAVAALRRRRK